MAELSEARANIQMSDF